MTTDTHQEHSSRNITADELFANVHRIATDKEMSGESAAGLMHDTLILVCTLGTKNSGQAYGNLFSQVDYLCRRCGMSSRDKHAIQRMRRLSNGKEEINSRSLADGIRALGLFISAVTGKAIPGELRKVMPGNYSITEERKSTDKKCIRCIVSEKREGMLVAETEDGWAKDGITIDISNESMAYVDAITDVGTQLNLINCTIDGTQVTPETIVVEPDFLVDISSVAACFTEFGHHEMAYTIARMRQRTDTYAILLGGYAGDALDDVINGSDGNNAAETIKRCFAHRMLEFCACKDFDAVRFKTDAARQTANIKMAVDSLAEDYTMSNTMLEPSFVCESLGLQGRVDMMTTDGRLLVEQKSGRNMNIERQTAGAHGSMQQEAHYVQLLLYYGVLRHNFGLTGDDIDIRLLYSKYEPKHGLLVVAFYKRLFQEAIKTRNLIVAQEMRMAKEGFESVMDDMTPETLNTVKSQSAFYQKYIYPQNERITSPIRALEGVEQRYFCRMMTFIYGEQRIGKTGGEEGKGNCAADLWGMPLPQKLESGNIYTGLTVKEMTCGGNGKNYNLVTLNVRQQGDDFIPNFRKGDSVYVYSYREGDNPDARNAMLFKGQMAEIGSTEIIIALNDGQRNKNFLTSDDIYIRRARTRKTQKNTNGNANDKHEGAEGNRLIAVEHATSDSSAGLIRSMHHFITAPTERKELLLGLRAPRVDRRMTLTKSYNNYYDDILLKAKQARDMFLLIGPPGTGKTSMALRYMVDEEIATAKKAGNDAGTCNILMLSYTNRAVDEICDMLESAGHEYLRIGNEHSCDKRFRHRLVGKMAEKSMKMSCIREEIEKTQIIVCTTSTLISRPGILDMKRFSLAIVDESSQILEPAIIGLLAAHRTDNAGEEQCRIERFILVGDYKQLPAVVRQDKRESGVDDLMLNEIGLTDCRNSLFERLIDNERRNGREDFIGILRRQGRMHPEIAEFPNRMFYNEERLQPVPLPHQEENTLQYALGETPDDIDRMLAEKRMIFIPSAFCRRTNVSEKTNSHEARIVADLLRRIHGFYGDKFNADKSVGVIVPYRNQIATIRKEIERTGISELLNVSIDTVERYQGSQRDVIIYSFTVQNRYQLDFLTSNCFVERGRVIDRKLNVAITRARKQMIVTGNEKILRTNDIFAQMIDFINEKGGRMEDSAYLCNSSETP